MRPTCLPRLACSVTLGLAATACATSTIDIGDDGKDVIDTADIDSGDPVCPDMALSAESFSFPEVPVGSTSSATLTVTNPCTGGDGLVVTLSIEGDTAFSVDAGGLTVAPDASAQVVVSYASAEPGSHVATLIVTSNSPVSPSGIIALDATLTGDADGDGFLSEAAGGDDCDDNDATVHPGANETWYDGIDSDCAGDDDYDQDGDGWASADWGGADCDDTDASVHPGGTETQDLLDNDCDGMVDEDFVLEGEVLITEVMHTPTAVGEDHGEWFEVQSLSTEAIDLVGWVFVGEDGDRFTVATHAVLIGGGRVVLGNDPDPATNGGAAVDATWDPSGFALAAADGIEATVEGRSIASVSWTEAWAGDGGASLALDPDHYSAEDAVESIWWCDAEDAMIGGGFGTPNAVNGQCSTVDEDGDGYSPAMGDCDDEDPDVSPRETEIWDGIDNDCDGLVDNAAVADVASAWFEGANSTYLGAISGLGVGDFTDDGAQDLAIGATYASSYAGSVWVIDSADIAGAAGSVSSYDAATISGESYNYFGSVPVRAGDQTGDGVDDLLVAGVESSYSYYGDGVAAAIFEGASSFGGLYDQGDAEVLVSYESSYSYGGAVVLADIDVNGDGIDEVVYGNPYFSSGYSYYLGSVAVFDVSDGEDVSAEDALATLSGDTYYDLVGSALGGGDIDGDGYDDLAVGAPGLDDAAGDGGAVFLLTDVAGLGEADIADAAATAIYGDSADMQVGFGHILLEDFDGNGKLDLVFGGFDSNAVFFFADAGTLNPELETGHCDGSITGSDSFGFDVVAADFDDDGHVDLAVGAPGVNTAYGTYSWYYSRGSVVGTTWMFPNSVVAAGGSASTADASRSLVGESSGDFFGAVLAAGDLDGDSVSDLVIAAPHYDTYATGRVYVVDGG
jgi:hypothetical protein